MSENFIFNGKRGSRIIAFESGLLQNFSVFKTDSQEGIVKVSEDSHSLLEDNFVDFQPMDFLSEAKNAGDIKGGFIQDDGVLLPSRKGQPMGDSVRSFSEEKAAYLKEEQRPALFSTQEVATLKEKMEEEHRQALEEAYRKGYDEALAKAQDDRQKQKNVEESQIREVMGKIFNSLEETLKEQTSACIYMTNFLLKRFFPLYAQEKRQEEIVGFIEEKRQYLQKDLPLTISVHPSMVQPIQKYLQEDSQGQKTAKSYSFSVKGDENLGILDTSLSWYDGGAQRFFSKLWEQTEAHIKERYGGPWGEAMEEGDDQEESL